MENNRVIILLLSIIALVAVVVILDYAQDIILPLIIAWLLSYILGPAVNFLVRKKIPLALAIFTVLLLLLGLCFLAGLFLFEQISSFAAEYPKYQVRLSNLFSAVTAKISFIPSSLQKIDWTSKIGSFLMTLSGSVLSFVAQLFKVIFFLIFMLLGKPYFKYKIKKAFSFARAEQISGLVSSISGKIGHYLSTLFLISFITSALVWLLLWLIGVDFAPTWAALTFFMNFIPVVGSVLASIPPVVLALVQFSPNYWQVIACLVSLVIIQNVMGNIIAPLLMGDTLNLSPIVILLSLLFWGWLWGMVGMLLSIPIASAIHIICANIKALQPISIMMSSGKQFKKEFEK